MPQNPLPANVLAQLDLGNKIEAIKLLRQSTGLDLKDAKNLIEQHLRRHPMPDLPPASDGALPFIVIDALKQGKKIEAIRLLRELRGIGLKQAKDAVDSFNPAPALDRDDRDGLSPGEVPKTKRGIWVVVMLAVVAIFIYCTKLAGAS